MAMFERFTEKAVRIIMAAQEEAKRMSNIYVGAEHLLLGMIRENENVVIKTLETFRSDPATVKNKIEEYLISQKRPGKQIELPFNTQAKKVIELAWEEARQLGHSYVGVEHLFLGLLREGTGILKHTFHELGIDTQIAKTRIIAILGEETAIPSHSDRGTMKTTVLDSFSRDLTRSARQRKLDPVVGRNKEIERVVQILSRRKKNNPVLIGEAGVGKTAIVEGLAQRIISGNVPPTLMDKRLVTLDLGSMIAGTKYRGEFEDRLKKVIEEVRKAKKVIIFIDELHTLIGAGAAEGAMDAANILKPALARGEIQTIGATTIDEFRKRIESDPALERRFQSVMVDEPSVEETVDILRGLRSRYEDFHKVRITDQALVSAARLSARYISERHLPDKAIDLIDEASSKVMLQSVIAPPELIEINRDLEKVRAEKEEVIEKQEFEAAAQLRDKEQQLRLQYEAVSSRIQGVEKDKYPEVDSEIIAQIISGWTGVPVTQLTEAETERLLKMEEYLTERVIGQEDAIKSLSKSIRRARAGLKDPRRPIGSFIFLGPSGVGKTELAKRVAEFLFGDIEAMVRIDMSEYLESHTVSRMIGSPPGYVGFGEGGQLAEPVRRKPHSVVLFDEIEKAHQDVTNILLQIMDEGKVTDAQGHPIDFKNTVVIMTSNVGAEFINKETGMGFVNRDDANAGYENMKSKVTDELKKKFKPEFINRIDETIVFRPLSREDLLLIVDIMVKDINERLQEKAIEITLSKKAKKYIVDKGFNPKMGARPLRRTIETNIEEALSEDILRGKFGYGSKIKADVEKDKIVFRGRSKKTIGTNSANKKLQEVGK